MNGPLRLVLRNQVKVEEPQMIRPVGQVGDGVLRGAVDLQVGSVFQVAERPRRAPLGGPPVAPGPATRFPRRSRRTIPR